MHAWRTRRCRRARTASLRPTPAVCRCRDLHAMLRAQRGWPALRRASLADAPDTRRGGGGAAAGGARARHHLGWRAIEDELHHLRERRLAVLRPPGAVARAVSDRQRQDFPSTSRRSGPRPWRRAAPVLLRRAIAVHWPGSGADGHRQPAERHGCAGRGGLSQRSPSAPLSTGLPTHTTTATKPFCSLWPTPTRSKAIIEVGFILQLDNPNLPDGFGLYTYLDAGVPHVPGAADCGAEPLHRGAAASWIRMHVCWGRIKGRITRTSR